MHRRCSSAPRAAAAIACLLTTPPAAPGVCTRKRTLFFSHTSRLEGAPSLCKTANHGVAARYRHCPAGRPTNDQSAYAGKITAGTAAAAAAAGGGHDCRPGGSRHPAAEPPAGPGCGRRCRLQPQLCWLPCGWWERDQVSEYLRVGLARAPLLPACCVRCLPEQRHNERQTACGTHGNGLPCRT